MIVVSVGMQKSGSGWYFNMQNDLLVYVKRQNIRDIRKKYRLHFILKDENCNIGSPNLLKIGLLLIPHCRGNTFVVKTHKNPTCFLRHLIKKGVVKVTYIYRDPRDVVVSSFRQGERLRSQNKTHTFAKLRDIESAMRYVNTLLKTWSKWMEVDGVLAVKYEDILFDPVYQMNRFSEFLSLDIPKERIQEIVRKYDGRRLNDYRKDILHFDKGVVGRYKEFMDQNQVKACNDLFGEYLRIMGYSID